ncbi:MAG: VIT1/CCC1 transporter family protein [Stackebrandtia sp.]
MADEQAKRPVPHVAEPHHAPLAGKLNWLRAGVLGANDGIVSVAGLVVGVAGATVDRTTILTAGVAGLAAGALSMAGGEYASVSAQRDTERAAVRLEQFELTTMPEAERRELAGIYEQKGLSPRLAAEVADELTKKDALRAHARDELGVDPDAPTNPLQAAFASFAAFTVGALLPLLAIVLASTSTRVAVCGIAVVAALAVTGYVSARLGRAHPARAVLRNVAVGVTTMAVTYAVGVGFGAAMG